MTSSLELYTSPQSFFRDHVVEALARLRLDVGVWTEFYLVDLLARKAPSLPMDQPLVTQLGACLENPRPFARFEGYRTLGDASLLLLGFFGDNVPRRGVNRSYVASMGRNAYAATAALSGSYDGLTAAYEDLSEGFTEFARVLDEVREMTSLRTPQDLLELYSRWKQTKSPNVAGRLCLGGMLFIPDLEDEN